MRVTAAELVKTSHLPEAPRLPLVLEPAVEGVNLASWVEGNRAEAESRLREHGALLFRGFGVSTVEGFEGVMRAFSPELMQYGERSSPRHRVGEGVYTSTDHPADQHILLHNEQSYTLNWPMKICFFCVRPAAAGGRTPIADSRRVLASLDPALVSEFERRQVMYVRNYGQGLGLPWEEVFQTTDRLEVERHCRRARLEFEWKGDGGLRTRQVRPAVRRHPHTGEAAWFNHALFFHFTSLEPSARASILAVVGEDDVPFNTFYGDGSPIEPATLDALREAYAGQTVAFDWRQGDILLLDNMLTAHGRESFEGPREVVVAMAEPYGGGDAREVIGEEHQ